MASAGTAYADLELNFDKAQSQLDEAIAGLEVPPLDVTFETDTSDVDAALAGVEADPIEIPVSADSEAAAAEIASLEADEIVMPVTADTEQAQAAVDQLSESTAGLGDVAQGAEDGMGGLAGAAGGAAGAFSATAAGGTAAAAALGQFAIAGIEAESAAQRFELVTGDLAGELSSIDVGGLSGDIGDLALQIGSSDEAMLNATATFVTFAESSSLTSDQVVETSDNINALALRAAAMNPALGDAGAVAERMAGAFARGGRALQPFGLDISAAEIKAHAAKMGLADLNGEIGRTEMAAAGAALAVEQAGASLGRDFDQGAENAALKMEALKESFGEAAESIGIQMLPALEQLSGGLTDLIDGAQNLDPGSWLKGLADVSSIGTVSNGLEQLGDQLNDTLADLGGMDLRFASPLVGLTTVLGTTEQATKNWAGEFSKVDGLLDSATSAADAAAAAISDLSAEIDDYLAGTIDLPAAQRDAQESITGLVEKLQAGESTWFELADAQDGVVSSTAQVIGMMNEQGASQEELDGYITSTIGMLRSERDAGRLTQDQFADLSSEIRGIPTKASTTVTTPGIIESSIRAREHREILATTDRDVHTWARVDVDRGEFDRLVRDLDAADNRRFAMQVSVNGPGAYNGGPVPGGPNESVPMTLHGGEYVLSADVVERIKSGRPSRGADMGAGGGGGGVTYQIYNDISVPAGSNSHEFAQAVVDAMSNWQRSNGTIPVRTL